MQDHHGALLPGQPPESALELVTTGDAQLRVVHGWWLKRHEMQSGLPPLGMPDLGVTGVDEESVEPCLQATVVAQGRQFSPCDQEGLLNGVLCSAGIAQDPVRDGVEPIAETKDECGERVFVASFRAIDEFRVNLPPSQPLYRI